MSKRRTEHTYVAQLCVSEVAADHHLKHCEQVIVADSAVAIQVVDAKRDCRVQYLIPFANKESKRTVHLVVFVAACTEGRDAAQEFCKCEIQSKSKGI